MAVAVTAEQLEHARRVVAAGGTQRDAARAVGLSPDTLRRHGIMPPKPWCGTEAQRTRSRVHMARLNKTWTRETLIGELRRWAAEYGAPPAAADWNRALARRQGREDVAQRHAAGDWPSYSTIVNYFGSWSAAITAAGYQPRPVGGRVGAFLKPVG